MKEDIVTRIKSVVGRAVIRAKSYAAIGEASIDVLAVAVLIGVVAFILFA